MMLEIQQKFSEIEVTKTFTNVLATMSVPGGDRIMGKKLHYPAPPSKHHSDSTWRNYLWEDSSCVHKT